jgi:hypothetical protein
MRENGGETNEVGFDNLEGKKKCDGWRSRWNPVSFCSALELGRSPLKIVNNISALFIYNHTEHFCKGYY